MEVHAVSGGWVLEWSGCTGSSIVKATVGVAGFLVVASGVVQGVRHRSLRWYSHKGRLASDKNKEPDAVVSNQAMKELEGEIGSASQAPDNQRVAMATARASELPVLIVSGADSPRSRIGRGLESIGGMTAETLQRISTAVGGVVKSPVVLISKVGGLASPRAAALPAPPSLPAPPRSSLVERLDHLENQMKSFEEKFSPMTVVTELDLSTHSHKEKPQIAKSLLQEMETDRTLEKRVQMLEDHVNECMDRFEKALLSIQSRLHHVELSWCERQESPSGEPQYYDAEQQSDNFDALEATEPNKFGVDYVPIVEHIEPLQEIDVGKDDDFLDPQIVSTPVYSKEAFLTHPMKSATPSSEPAECDCRDDVGNFPASSDRQLESTLEELHGSFVKQSSEATASAKFLEIARAVTVEKSTLAHTSPKPREAFLEDPLVAAPIAKFEEHAQDVATNESGTNVAVVELPLLEATKKDFMKEPLAATPNAKLAQELATQGFVIIALASSESPVTSKSMEESLVVVPSANSEEPAQEGIGDKNDTMTTIGESSKAFPFRDSKEDFVKESLAGAPSVGLAHEPSSQEDSNTTHDMALASSESPMASKFVEEPLVVFLGTNFEELALKDSTNKSGSTIVGAELPLASSLEDSQEEVVKEFTTVVPSAESTQVLTTHESNDISVVAHESQMASKFVEAPLAIAPSVDSKELAQEDVEDETMATKESSLASSLEEHKEGFEKETMAFAPIGEFIQERSNMAATSSKTEGASKFVEASLAARSANFRECEHMANGDESGAISEGVESPSTSSFVDSKDDFEKESLGATPNVELARKLATQDDSSKTLATPDTTMTLKYIEDPSTTIMSVGFEELVCKDVDKGVAMTATSESPMLTSHQGPKEDFEKESLVAAPSDGSIHEPSSQKDLGTISDDALPSSEPQVTIKLVEEPSSAIPSANVESLAYEDEFDKSVTMIATTDLPLASPYHGLQKDFEREALATSPSVGPIHEPSSLEGLGATSHMALASCNPLGGSKIVEEPSSNIFSANSKDPTHEDGAIKNDTVITDVKSPLASSFEESQEEFEKEPMVDLPNIELAQKLAIQEESDMAPASSESKVASKFMEEPSAVVPSRGFEKPAHEDVANKSVFGPTHELLSLEDLDAISDVAFSSSTPHLASKFTEKPSPTIPSANFEEQIHDEDAIHRDTMNDGEDLPLASSFGKPQEDFEKESLAATLSHESTQGLETEEDSHMVPTSTKSQEASKSIEEPSAVVPSVDFEEPTHEDAVDKSVAMTDVGVLPFVSSFEGPKEDSRKESNAVAPSIERGQKLATQDDSDMVSFEPQVASKFVEEPLATNVSNAKFEEPVHEDTIDMNGSVIVAIEYPSVSSLEVHGEDYTKESLVSGTSAKVLPIEEDESGKSPIAFAPSEAPSSSVFGISQKDFLKEPSETSVQSKELAQEKSGIVLPSAEPILTLKEGNLAAKEAEYKLVEDFKVHHEHIKSNEKEFPRSHSNLAHVGFDESLVAEDCDDHLESDQSGEEFFDAEHGSGNFEPWESDEPKSFEKFSIGSDERSEAMRINVAAQKEALAPTSSMKPSEEPSQVPAQKLKQDHESTEQAHVQEQEQKPTEEQEQHTHGQHHAQELEQQSTQEHGQQPAQEHGLEIGQKHGKETTQASRQEHEEEPEQEPKQELGHKFEQQPKQLHVQESEQDHTRYSAMALLPSEPQVTSKSGESQELLVEEPLAAIPRIKFEEPVQANVVGKNSIHDLPLTPTVEEPQIDIAMSLEKSLSGPLFHQSSNPELLENVKHKSLDAPGTSSTPQEALERDPLLVAPTTEIAHEHDIGKSDNVHTSLEPQLEESKEVLANEPVKAIPYSESIELTQEVGDGQSGAELTSLEPQLTPTLEESHEGFMKEPSTNAEVASKSVDLEELSAVTSAKLAQESVIDKINAGLAKESPMIPIAEEPQSGSVSSLGESKHGQDQANQKFLEDVKIITKPIKEAIPRTQSDLTHVKLNPEASEDTTKLQSQGSFLAFGSMSVDSKEALVKEPLPSSKLLELFEEENGFGKRDPMLVDSQIKSIVEEPHKPPVVEPEPSTSAKLVPKGHSRWRGFSRSNSEPQFAYKLEEHRKVLAKGSSVAATVPSASKLGEEHAQEDFGDMQCLPFKILGEGKPPRKEPEFKLVQDVKSPAMKLETTPNPYVLEPKPSKIKEKKKKEKKERKPDAPVEEKERRLSLGMGEMERKSSLRVEEKNSKYSPRAEEKHKQPFRQLRDRLRHAFSVNKEP